MASFTMYNNSYGELIQQREITELENGMTLETLDELERISNISSEFIIDRLRNSTENVIMFHHVLIILDSYFVPLIVLIGVAGNCLSFVVFMATHLKRSSCHIYLASLAVADNVFLICVFISWGKNIGISLYHQQGGCQVLMFLTHVSSFLSVWYVVSFTVERWLITCHPLKRNRLYTTRDAKIVVTSLAVFAFLAYLYTIFTSGVLNIGTTKFCAPLPQYYKVVLTMDNIDTLITLIIPTFVIIGCNIHIIRVVYSFYKIHGEMTKRQPVQKWDFSLPSSKRNCGKKDALLANNDLRIPHSFNTTQSSMNSISVNKSSHMRATRMLLIVSTVFIVCNLPNHATRSYSFVMTIIDETYTQPQMIILVQKLFLILNYINFSMNFFLYSLSGRSFRTGLKRLRIKIRRKLKGMTCINRDNGSPECSPRMISKTDASLPFGL